MLGRIRGDNNLFGGSLFLQTPSMTHSTTMCESSEMEISFLRNKFLRTEDTAAVSHHKWNDDYLLAGVLVSICETGCHRCYRLLSFDGYLHLMRHSIFHNAFARPQSSIEKCMTKSTANEWRGKTLSFQRFEVKWIDDRIIGCLDAFNVKCPILFPKPLNLRTDQID